MKKKLIILGIIAALIITGGIVSGVWDRTPFYEIIEEDGQHYLVMDPDWLEPLSRRNYTKKIPQWESVKEAKDAIVAGRISLDELTALFGERNMGSKNRIPILDPDLICDLKLPDGISVDEVIWRGDSYEVNFSGKLGVGTAFVEQQYLENDEFVSRCHRKYQTLGQRYTAFTIEKGEDITYVVEQYHQNTEGIIYKEMPLPNRIIIYGISNGKQFKCKINNVKARFTEEQLRAFTLVPIES